MAPFAFHTTIIAVFWMLMEFVRAASDRRFPEGPWWKKLAFELAIALPPLLVLAYLLHGRNLDDVSTAAFVSGIVVGKVASLAILHFFKGPPR